MPWTSALSDYPEYVAAIGMVSIENANLELSCADLLAATLTVSRRVAHAIYFTPRASALRLDILDAAAAEKLAPRSKSSPDHPLEVQKRVALHQVERLVKRARAAVQKRHDIIHDAWGVSREEAEPRVIRHKTKGAPFEDASPVSITDLETLVKTFRDLIDEVESLAAQFRAQPPSMANMRKSSTKAGDSAIAESAGKPASDKN